VVADQHALAAATDFLHPWLFAVTQGRPFVTAKVAATLDGRVAAADGTSKWLTGAAARQWAHRELRAVVDAIAVGAGTVRSDAPRLTVRGVDVVTPPARYVIGEALADGFRTIPGHDPAVALDRMYGDGVRHLLLEGGPTVITAFLRAGLVDDLVWMTAPALLGAGTAAIGELGIATVADTQRWGLTDVRQLGDDILIRSRRR
jgi:diaminohydroxyphosphoribosylaminopyrimidine deaminase/5-amino-6-(5-phosphoribosylamino)uracil reductase